MYSIKAWLRWLEVLADVSKRDNFTVLGLIRRPGELAPRKVTTELIRKYLGELDDTGRSAHNYANHLNCLQLFYCEFLQKPELVASFRTPDKPVSLVKVPSKLLGPRPENQARLG